MKISDKIHGLHELLKNNPGSGLETKIKDESMAAMFDGIGRGGMWERYMLNFCSNPDQLRRLCGEDGEFMNDEDGYGPQSLAYIVGSGPCGGGTILGMAANMPPLMRMHLDDNVNLATEDCDCLPLPQEAKALIEKENAIGQRRS